jgi:hypothetical protein
MAFCSLSKFNSTLSILKKQEIRTKPTNVSFLDTIGPFNTSFSGTDGSISSSTTKTITGNPNPFLNGIYTIKCNYWAMELSNPQSYLGMMFDNSNATYCSSVWSTVGVRLFNYSGNQTSSYSTPSYSISGTYNLGSTYYTINAGTTDPSYVGDFIDVLFPMPVIVKTYQFMPRNVNNNSVLARFPKQLYFFGSNSDDDASWKLLGSHLNNALGVMNNYTNVSLSSTTGYTKYRVVINSLVGLTGFHTTLWNLSNINLIFDVV